ncbi:unnamed protein product [Commensalibacter communis]|uniref:Uncharacterized protein n=1 Tax=Commensalibacter communis TaxID=2972786 RepID=A0A9W4TQX7_9PROT|nr:hypothetical protein [Commensalibacter communis]CAI3954015.1 unnamed protein product [Commensalibacter communis]CAI3956159.1 unnamed protein product [Commensalibacter communis]CAI3956550.1 unnamed protein product [Commensalibacter communis]CAI3957116.1 unnamed protein product [Commensalibacter communis]
MMETENKIVGYEGLAKILGLSEKYLPILRKKNPERLPPPTRASKTKWHIDVVNDWLKDDNNNKPARGRKRKMYNIL